MVTKVKYNFSGISKWKTQEKDDVVKEKKMIYQIYFIVSIYLTN